MEATISRILHVDEIKQDDIILAVVGQTGAGKSTFINTTAGRDILLVNHGLTPTTSDVQHVECSSPERYGNRRIVFVDIPAFDDEQVEQEVEGKLRRWLRIFFSRNAKISGILYLHRITDSNITDPPGPRLALLKSLCEVSAGGFPNRVMMVTTMWSNMYRSLIAREREMELQKCWDELPMGSASLKVQRFEDSFESAWSIVFALLEDEIPISLQSVCVEREEEEEEEEERERAEREGAERERAEREGEKVEWERERRERERERVEWEREKVEREKERAEWERERAEREKAETERAERVLPSTNNQELPELVSAETSVHPSPLSTGFQPQLSQTFVPSSASTSSGLKNHLTLDSGARSLELDEKPAHHERKTSSRAPQTTANSKGPAVESQDASRSQNNEALFLNQLKEFKYLYLLDESWPPDDLVSLLSYIARYSTDLASLAVRYLRDPFIGDPQSQLDRLLDTFEKVIDDNAQELPHLYDSLCSDILSRIPPAIYDNVKRILVPQVLSKDSPSLAVTCDNLRIEHSEAYEGLCFLHPVLSIPSRQDIMHKSITKRDDSFLPFLTDSSRSGKYAIAGGKDDTSTVKDLEVINEIASPLSTDSAETLELEPLVGYDVEDEEISDVTVLPSHTERRADGSSGTEETAQKGQAASSTFLPRSPSSLPSPPTLSTPHPVTTTIISQLTRVSSHLPIGPMSFTAPRTLPLSSEPASSTEAHDEETIREGQESKGDLALTGAQTMSPTPTSHDPITQDTYIDDARGAEERQMVMEAERAETDRAELETDQAELETDQAESEIEEAETETDQAESETEEAGLETETAEWEAEKAKWEMETAEWESQRAEWRREEVEWEREKERWKRETAEWEREREREREEAELETETAEWEAEKAKWEMEKAEWETRRAEWRREEVEWVRERERWKRERAEWERERAEWERERVEEEEGEREEGERRLRERQVKGAQQKNYPVARQLLLDLTGTSTVKALESLQDESQPLIDFLSKAIDDIPDENRAHALCFMVAIAKSAQVYPRWLELKGVECDVTAAVNSGSSGCIYKGKLQDRPICVKAVRMFQTGAREEDMRALAGEIVISAHISHPNIHPIHGVYLSDEMVPRICVVSPWMENGSLTSYLKAAPKTRRIPLLSDILSGLCHIHGQDIVHSNLKGSNVLIKPTGHAVLAGLGSARIRMASAGVTVTVTADFSGTINWMAPELLTEDTVQPPTQESDMWAFGCVCYEVFTGEIPFERYRATSLMRALMIGGVNPVKPVVGSSTSPEIVGMIDSGVLQLMEKCWDYNPKNRPTAEQAYSTVVDLHGEDIRPSIVSELTMSERSRDSVMIDYQVVCRALQRVGGHIRVAQAVTDIHQIRQDCHEGAVGDSVE